jgi:hypothetical protein
METRNERDVHTCSYECERPACIRAQRDELRGRLEALAAEGVQAGGVEQRLASARRASARADVTRTAMVWCKDIKDGSTARAFDNAIEELERAAIASALSQQPEARGVVVDEAAEDAAAIDKAWGRFKAALAKQPAAVDEAMVERVAVAIYAAARGFSADVARETWPSVEQKSRFTGPARAALEGDAS